MKFNQLAARRLAAYALDVAGYLGIAAATAPVGALSTSAGWDKSQAFVISVSVVPVIIATGVAARAEVRGATWGKRRLGLRVERSDGQPLSLARAISRNVLKIAVPWQLGHIVAIGTVYGGFESSDRRLIAVSLLTYGVIGIGFWGLLRRSGIAMHDMAVNSRVYCRPICTRVDQAELRCRGGV
ncbi:RDD family protein [Nesterenkonia ebinurensis]|uniref:RDD family protein n=1 Tax=Nesterenkonia ebinurensis TaxID=2608252 RepID=UPI00123DD0AC|nr:RDD family protein [Nesterenkonia ebinurensis]